jgi:hypothetical protein
MPQKFAFTTAAMAAALEDTPVSYEDLADIERDFDDVEVEISKWHLRVSPALSEHFAYALQLCINLEVAIDAPHIIPIPSNIMNWALINQGIVANTFPDQTANKSPLQHRSTTAAAKPSPKFPISGL